MTPKDWFGVLVRGAGLYLIVIAIGQGAAALLEREMDPLHVSSSRMPYCLLYLGAGVLAIRFADAVVRFAYPDRPMQPPEGDAPKS